MVLFWSVLDGKFLVNMYLFYVKILGILMKVA